MVAQPTHDTATTLNFFLWKGSMHVHILLLTCRIKAETPRVVAASQCFSRSGCMDDRVCWLHSTACLSLPVTKTMTVLRAYFACYVTSWLIAWLLLPYAALYVAARRANVVAARLSARRQHACIAGHAPAALVACMAAWLPMSACWMPRVVS